MTRHQIRPRRALPASALLFGAVLALAACETATGNGNTDLLPAGSSFAVQTIDGAAAPEGTSLTVDQEDRVTGQGPCNRYFGALTRSEGGIAIGPVGATRMACLDGGRSQAETGFFTALEAVTGTAAGPGTGQVALTDGTGATRILLAPAD